MLQYYVQAVPFLSSLMNGNCIHCKSLWIGIFKGTRSLWYQEQMTFISVKKTSGKDDFPQGYILLTKDNTEY